MVNENLKEELSKAKYNGMDEETVLSALKLKNIPSFVVVSYLHVVSYLSIKRKMRGIIDKAESNDDDIGNAKDILYAVETFPDFNFNKPFVKAEVERVLSGLVEDGLIDQDEQSYILSLADGPLISLEIKEGLGNVAFGHVTDARVK